MGKEKRPFCFHKIFVPSGLSSPARGYIHVKKYKKKGKKLDFKEILFKLATKKFLLMSKFCPQGVVCLCPGAIYMYKII